MSPPQDAAPTIPAYIRRFRACVPRFRGFPRQGVPDIAKHAILERG